MELEHEFVVSVPPADAWDVLLDVERVAPCMPGATLDEVQGDNFSGRVKVKVGPITVSYKGRAEFLEKDATARRVVIRADGREERGAGTAGATVTAQLHDAGAGRTRVHVRTDLAITGKPAQFGRGVMVEIGNALIGQFAARLERQIAVGVEDASVVIGPAEARAEPRETVPHTSGSQVRTGGRSTTGADAGANGSPGSSQCNARPADGHTEGCEDALDLGLLAWRPVLRRAAPAAAILLAFLILIRLAARARRR